MSLVNRMLKDLSTREPTSANVMQGIRLDTGSAAGGSRRSAIWLILGLLVAGAAWWWWSERQAASAPVAASTPVAAPGPVASAPAQPVVEQSAEAKAPLARFVLDENLSAVPVPRTTRRPAPPKVTASSTAATAAPKAATALPAPSPARNTVTARERYDEAMRAIERGDLETAEQRLADALALDPKFNLAREELGNLRVEQERWTDAERSVRRGFEEDPAWAGYRRLAARLALARNLPAEALEHLTEQEVPSVRDDAEYNGLLASAYQRLNRHEDASRIYRALASDQPEQGHWWAGYAISREALGDLDNARRSYAQALRDPRLDPRVTRYVRGRLEALKPASG